MSFSGGMYFLAVCGCNRMCCTSCRNASHLGPCLNKRGRESEWASEPPLCQICNLILTRQLGRPHRQRSRVSGRPCSVAAMASRVCEEHKVNSGAQCGVWAIRAAKIYIYIYVCEEAVDLSSGSVAPYLLTSLPWDIKQHFWASIQGTTYIL